MNKRLKMLHHLRALGWCWCAVALAVSPAPVDGQLTPPGYGAGGSE